MTFTKPGTERAQALAGISRSAMLS